MPQPAQLPDFRRNRRQAAQAQVEKGIPVFFVGGDQALRKFRHGYGLKEKDTTAREHIHAQKNAETGAARTSNDCNLQWQKT